jgi:isocitrate dehydrogenase (NAD+)
MIVDNASMQLVMRPEQFDILLCENLYGDIVDLCAGLIGGLGPGPAQTSARKAQSSEAVHGSAPDIAGKGIANPTALLQSAVLMLSHIEERPAADKIETALLKIFAEGKLRTRDIGGTASTNEFADAVIAAMR